MKALGLILVIAAAVTAQDPKALAAAGCGPSEVRFNVKTTKNHPNVLAENGKALVYVIEDFVAWKEIGCLGGGCSSIIRTGLDGSWIGAVKDNSYLSFAVEPGEHNVCGGWQIPRKWFQYSVSATAFTAEPGKTYYFVARVNERFTLEKIDKAEGQALISTRKFSTFSEKK